MLFFAFLVTLYSRNSTAPVSAFVSETQMI